MNISMVFCKIQHSNDGSAYFRQKKMAKMRLNQKIIILAGSPFPAWFAYLMFTEKPLVYNAVIPETYFEFPNRGFFLL